MSADPTFRMATRASLTAIAVASAGLFEVVLVVLLAQAGWPALTAWLLGQDPRAWVHLDPALGAFVPAAIATWSMGGAIVGWRTVVLTPSHLRVLPELDVPWDEVAEVRADRGVLAPSVTIRTTSGTTLVLYSPLLFGSTDPATLAAHLRARL